MLISLTCGGVKAVVTLTDESQTFAQNKKKPRKTGLFVDRSEAPWWMFELHRVAGGAPMHRANQNGMSSFISSPRPPPPAATRRGAERDGPLDPNSLMPSSAPNELPPPLRPSSIVSVEL